MSDTLNKHRLRSRQSATALVGMHIRDLILARGLGPGTLLPTYYELCAELGVSYLTIKRGMDVLEAEGIIRRVPSKGTFVVKDLCRQPRPLSVVVLAFPFSLNTVLMQDYTLDIVRGALGALDETGNNGKLHSLVGEGLLYADNLGAHTGGLLFTGVENDSYLRMVAGWGTPAVALDYCSDSVPMDFVACDNPAAARQVVKHLAGLGHRRIAYLGDAEAYTIRPPARPEESLVLKSSDKRERREGVREALTELGLPPPVETVLAPFSTASQRSGSVGQVAADWFADRKSAPTAVVTSDDSCAEALIAHLGRMGLRVPEDVSVCTLACADTHRHPGLTHCRFDFAAMGRKGVDLLREHCRCPVEPVNRIHRIGFEWVEGGSTRGARE